MTAHRGQLLSHYRLLKKLGEGEGGVVWEAVDTRLDHQVAIKVLSEGLRDDASRLARFEREARAIAALNHPNIATVHSFEEGEGERFFTMELVAGRTLNELIPKTGLTLESFLELSLPLTAALSAAHAGGITHGDLRPRNIMVSERGEVKVLDFCLARGRETATRLGAGAAITGRTAPVSDSAAPTAPRVPPPSDRGVPLPDRVVPIPDLSEVSTDASGGDPWTAGSIPYRSPEQIQGRPLDHHTDIFSLGVILYEMATGRRPLEGKTPAETAAAISRRAPVSILEVNPSLPPALGEAIMRCLEKDPLARLQARDLHVLLQALAGEAGAPGREPAVSIAVLPFADKSPAKDQEHLCEGVADEITNSISRIRNLHVVPRTSSTHLKGAMVDSREIGRRLGVGKLLEGFVHREGSQVRIDVRIIDVAGGDEVWAERYDRAMKEIFAIQEEIAGSVLGALELPEAPHERSPLGRTLTKNTEAYDLYLRGRKHFQKCCRREIDAALQTFSRAIEIDQDFAAAHAGLADCRAHLFMIAGRDEAHLRKADSAARRALELDPCLAEAHISRGVVLSLSGRAGEADRAFETAMRLNPAMFEAYYLYARHCFALGGREKAARLLEQAIAVRPEDFQSSLLVAQLYDDLGRLADAAAARKRGVAIAEECLKLDPHDVRALCMGANALIALAERERGLEWADRALSLDPDEPMVLYNAACTRALAAQTEDAIDILEKAVGSGFAHREWVENDSNIDMLRSHPRFHALLKQLR